MSAPTEFPMKDSERSLMHACACEIHHRIIPFLSREIVERAVQNDNALDKGKSTKIRRMSHVVIMVPEAKVFFCESEHSIHNSRIWPHGRNLQELQTAHKTLPVMLTSNLAHMGPCAGYLCNANKRFRVQRELMLLAVPSTRLI